MESASVPSRCSETYERFGVSMRPTDGGDRGRGLFSKRQFSAGRTLLSEEAVCLTLLDSQRAHRCEYCLQLKTSAAHNSSDSCSSAGSASSVGGIARLSRCARCQCVRFCSRACQRSAWPTHRALCSAVASLRQRTISEWREAKEEKTKKTNETNETNETKERRSQRDLAAVGSESSSSEAGAERAIPTTQSDLTTTVDHTLDDVQAVVEAEAHDPDGAVEDEDEDQEEEDNDDDEEQVQLPKSEAELEPLWKPTATVVLLFYCVQLLQDPASAVWIDYLCVPKPLAQESEGESRAMIGLTHLCVKLLRETSTPPSLDVMRRVPNLIRMLKANAFNVLGSDLIPVAVGLYPAAAMLNHQCAAPNASVVFEGRRLYARSLCAISAGSELTTSYVELAATAAERRRELRDAFAFECQCTACSDPAADRDAVLVQRHRTLDEGLQACLDVHRYDEALGYAEQLSRTAKQLYPANWPILGITLLKEGKLHRLIGQLREAGRCFEEALQVLGVALPSISSLLREVSQLYDENHAELAHIEMQQRATNE